MRDYKRSLYSLRVKKTAALKIEGLALYAIAFVVIIGGAVFGWWVRYQILILFLRWSGR